MADENLDTSTPVAEPTADTHITEPTLETEPSPQVVTGEAEPEVKAGDSLPVSWLPEDLRGNERLKDFDSPEALARAYATAELAQEVPESYQLPESIPKELNDWAKTNKLSQPQLDSMLELHTNMQKADLEHQSKLFADGRKALFGAWGKEKADNLKTAEAVFSSVESGKEMAAFIKKTGQGSNPVVIKFLHEIGRNFKEGGFLKQNTVTGEPKKDPLKARYPTMFTKDE